MRQMSSRLTQGRVVLHDKATCDVLHRESWKQKRYFVITIVNIKLFDNPITAIVVNKEVFACGHGTVALVKYQQYE